MGNNEISSKFCNTDNDTIHIAIENVYDRLYIIRGIHN